jgi:hypothetical protein
VIVVFVLPSSEYPIAEIDCPQQTDEVAFSANGDESCDP